MVADCKATWYKTPVRVKIFLCAVISGVLLANGTAFGQWRSFIREDLDMIGYVTIGANLTTPDELNDILRGNGFPAASALAASWGGGMHGMWKNRIAFGTSYHRLFSKRGTNDRFRTSRSSSLKLLDLGYPAFIGKNMQAYPLIGIGMVSENLTVYPAGRVSFGEIMTDPGRGSSLSRQGLILDIGVQANRFTLKGKKKQYSWGLRAGYRFVPAQRSWRMNGSVVDGGPGSGAEGPYLHVNFGMAGLISAIRDKIIDEKWNTPRPYSE